ncbi:MAG: hypothetical protein ACOVPA_10210 [Rubrivivax sp.]
MLPALPSWLHLTHSTLTILTGWIFGFAGLNWLLGHLFMTRFPRDRDVRITAVL